MKTAPGLSLVLLLAGVFAAPAADGEPAALIARIRAEIGRPSLVIATGGLALLFDEHTTIFDAVEPDLTLQGLAILAERALQQ